MADRQAAILLAGDESTRPVACWEIDTPFKLDITFFIHVNKFIDLSARAANFSRPSFSLDGSRTGYIYITREMEDTAKLLH
jgi:hypothetical protein